jgi:hypothetical protein
MSIAEMKSKIIEKINSFDDEEILKNILNELVKNENTSEVKVYNLSQHFESISKRYDKTLKKLAK